MPARLVKKAVGSASEKASNYKQFVDVDSDDPLEKDGNLPESGKAKTPPLKHSHPCADSSSEGHDVEQEMYKKKQDFFYQELEDEYGSKKCLNPVPHGDYEKDDSSDAGQSQEETPAADQDLIRAADQQPPQQHSSEQAHPMDRIVGHEYGVKPLLDDDELSDSELNACMENQPLTLKKYDTNAYRSDESEKTSMQTHCTDSKNPEQISTFLDPFASAPFRRKGLRSKMPKKPKCHSSAIQREGDVFANAPFRSYKITSPQSYVGQPVEQFSASEVVSNVGLPTDGITSYSHLSPHTVQKHSSSQSPERTLQPTSPSFISDMGAREARQFASNSFQQQPFSDGQQQKLIPKEQQQQQLLVADQQNIAEQQQCWQKQLQASWKQMLSNEVTIPAAGFKTSPSEQIQKTSLSPQSISTRVAQPPSVLCLADCTENNQPQIQSPHSPSSESTEDPTQDLYSIALIQGKEHDKQHHSLPESVSTQSGTSGGRVCKHRYGSSALNSDKLSPQNSRNDFSHVQLKSSDASDDESADAHYGSLKRNKQRSSKKSPREKPTTEFANLGFDDSEKDIDALEGERFCESGSQLNVSMDAAMLRTNNNSTNCFTEGSHTLPRMGAKKHRVLPQTPDNEPFSMKKKSSVIMFK